MQPDPLCGCTDDEVRAIYAAALPNDRIRLLERLETCLKPPLTLPELARDIVGEEYIPRAHTDALLEALTRAVDRADTGEDTKLIVAMPPGAGKSMTSSVVFPLWLLLNRPDWEIALVSAEASLATKFSGDVRRHYDERATVPGAGGVTDWGVGGSLRGGIIARGIKGSMSGRRLRCVHGTTGIVTEYGRTTAAEAYERGDRFILAYDHQSGRPVMRPVEASARSRRDELVEISTTAGRRLLCSPDHPIYSGDQYVPAGSLRPGAALVAAMGPAGVPVREPVREGSGRAAEVDQASGQEEPLLLAGMREQNCGYRSAQGQCLPVRRANPQFGTGVLLEGMPQDSRISASATTSAQVSELHDGVRPEDDRAGLLHSTVRGPRSLATDAGGREHPLGARHRVQGAVPQAEATDQAPGPAPLRRVLERRHELTTRPGSAPHRPRQAAQPSAQPDHPVPSVPHEASQVGADTVSVVRRIRGGSHYVYDFQVAGDSNFFADGLLTHNCAIIDDPIKHMEDAYSKRTRDTAWTVWQSVIKPRMRPGSIIISIATRWHDDDLSGRLLKQGGWETLVIPALAEENDQLGRKVGEPLLSVQQEEDQYDAMARWESIKIEVGSSIFNALYQQHPGELGGTIFKLDWWRYYTEDELPPADQVITSWDLSFGTAGETSGDWVVGQAWQRTGNQYYLLDQIRFRGGFTEQLARMRTFIARFPTAIAHVVEQAANGAAAIETLQKELDGVVPVKPDGSKIVRAQAVSPLVEAHQVHLPSGRAWLDDFVTEHTAFPTAAHDDQVDTTGHALRRMRHSDVGEVVVQTDRPRLPGW